MQEPAVVHPPKTTLRYSEPLVRQAVRAFWWRSVGPMYVAAVLVSGVSTGMLILSGDRSWLVGVAGTLFGTAILLAAVLYVTHHRASLGRFRRMKHPEAVLELTDTHLRIRSDVASSEIAWSQVSDLWQFRDFWLLFLTPAQFMTLPTADLNEAQRSGLSPEPVSRSKRPP